MVTIGGDVIMIQYDEKKHIIYITNKKTNKIWPIEEGQRFNANKVLLAKERSEYSIVLKSFHKKLRELGIW